MLHTCYINVSLDRKSNLLTEHQVVLASTCQPFDREECLIWSHISHIWLSSEFIFPENLCLWVAISKMRFFLRRRITLICIQAILIESWQEGWGIRIGLGIGIPTLLCRVLESDSESEFWPLKSQTLNQKRDSETLEGRLATDSKSHKTHGNLRYQKFHWGSICESSSTGERLK